MEWSQFIILVFTIGALFFWSRSESKEDARRCQDLIMAIKDEIKDFHGRLCKIEGEKKKK